MSKCCICGGKYEGYGHNAQPIKNGRCCDNCNYEKVIIERLKVLRKDEVVRRFI